jgi:hypothetical protein
LKEETEISYNCCERSAARTKKEDIITIEKFNNYAEDFYDTCTEYIQKSHFPFLIPLQPIDSINLKGKVTWKSVQANYASIMTVVLDLSLV